MGNPTADLGASSLADAADTTNDLYLQLKSIPEKNQIQVIQELGNVGEPGLAALMLFLSDRYQTAIANAVVTDTTDVAPSNSSPVPDPIGGMAYQTLFNATESEAVADFLQAHFPQGIVPLRSDAGMDYLPLQQLLAGQQFQAADKLTIQKMCEVAGAAAVQRKWLYFTEVDQLPIADLRTIDALWLTHSSGKFGFSVQRELWLGSGKNWDQLWSKIGWRTNGAWTRYPQEFTWDLSAPKGHLPLSNQLRGVRVIAALFNHPAWV